MMLVSGVLMSCETFVMSSVLSRSLLSCLSMAAAMPSPMEFKFSAWRLTSQYIHFVSTCASRLPAARASPSFWSFRSWSEKRHAATDSTSIVSSIAPPARFAANIPSIMLTTRQPRAVRQIIGMACRRFITPRPKAQSTPQHHLTTFQHRHKRL